MITATKGPHHINRPRWMPSRRGSGAGNFHRLTAPRREASQPSLMTKPKCHRSFGCCDSLVSSISNNAPRCSKKSAERRFACADGCGLNDKPISLLHRTSKRGESAGGNDKAKVSSLGSTVSALFQQFTDYLCRLNSCQLFSQSMLIDV